MKKIQGLDLASMAILLPLTFYLDSLHLTGTVPSIVIIGLSLALLIIASDRFLDSAKSLAFKALIPEIIIGLTIVSIGTSLPEIASTAMASYNAKLTGNLGYSDLAIGNIYGSVLVQITLMLGIVILVQPMRIHRNSIKRDGLAMILAVILLTVFVLIDMKLDLIESIILVVLYTFYVGYLLRKRQKILEEEGFEEEEKPDSKFNTVFYITATCVSLAVVVMSSNFLVNACINFAMSIGVAGGVVGLTISSVGTSLPELAIALIAVKSAKGISIGTLIGSNVTDPMLSIGTAGIVYPITIPNEGFALFTHITVPGTIIACVVSVIFMWTKYELERWEGFALVVCYVVFIILLVMFM